MNAEIRQIKSAAEQGLSEAFAQVKHQLAGDDTISGLREAAFRQFEAAGLPHRRVEEYKYTDLRALMRDAKPLAPPPDAQAKSRAKDASAYLAGSKARRIAVVDGAFAADLSDLADLEAGVAIHSLADALTKSDGETVRHVGNVMPLNGDPVVALNTAFMGDGVVVHIADGVTLERPLQLDFVTTGEAAHAVFTRSVVVVGKGASVTLIESHEGPDGVDYHVNHALELAIGDNAVVDHIKVARDGDKAMHLGTLMGACGKNVTLNDFYFNAGGAVLRNQLALRFDGEGTNATIGGISLLRHRQHADTTMVIDHAIGHCTGRQLFKSVLDDESRSVFQGKIIVRPDAQKTDGKMMTRALLLSEGAEADSKPELEIFADDVICGHGATTGALDPDLLFYLRARGIPKREAEALMVQAFIGETLEAVTNEGLRDALMGVAAEWLAVRG